MSHSEPLANKSKTEIDNRSTQQTVTRGLTNVHSAIPLRALALIEAVIAGGDT